MARERKPAELTIGEQPPRPQEAVERLLTADRDVKFIVATPEVIERINAGSDPYTLELAERSDGLYDLILTEVTV